MQGNKLFGPIPQTISNMSSLEQISLTTNNFSGTFSCCIMRHICDISFFGDIIFRNDILTTILTTYTTVALYPFSILFLLFQNTAIRE
jgi:hypothetical protein